MSNDTQQEQAALADLQKQATTPEDTKVLHQWEDEIDEKRAEGLKLLTDTRPMHELVEHAGVVVDAQAVAEARAQGQDVAAHNTTGRQA